VWMAGVGGKGGCEEEGGGPAAWLWGAPGGGDRHRTEPEGHRARESRGWRQGPPGPVGPRKWNENKSKTYMK